MEFLRYKPSGLWMMDDTSPLQDYSGYSASATISGTEVHGLPLSSYAVFSQVLSSTVTATFASLAYRPGREADAFSLCASILPINRGSGTISAQRILSNSGLFDGLSINGTVISFSTQYTSTGSATCSYDIQYRQKVDIVGVHGRTKNSLYINGVLVDEVDITDEQQADTYAAADNNLYSGGTSGNTAIGINAVSVYTRALQTEEVKRIYDRSNRRATSNVPAMLSGEDALISSSVRDMFLNSGWFTDEDWSSASLTNVVVEDSQLRPTMDSGLTMAGIWEDTIDLYVGETPIAINSVNMLWSGENELVEASVDGTTWETVSPGVNLTSIPTGFDPTGKSLFVRVSFPADLTHGFIDNLRVNGYLSNTAQPPNGRTVTYTNPIVTLDDYDPALFNDNWGVRILGGTLALAADTSNPILTAQTVEIWYKKLSATEPTLTGLTTDVTSYINGAAGTTSNAGEWVIRHFVKGTGGIGAFSLAGNIQVGKIAVYPSKLTTTDMATLISNYLGVADISQDGSGALVLTESATPAVIYAHDWEIVAS